MILSIPSPIQELKSELLTEHKIKLFVKREDLIHPVLNGNKYRKLKYNLEHFRAGDYSHIVTFGGAFSNHIHAVASAGNLYNIPTVGIIRGEPDAHNPTTNHASHQGMELRYVDRTSYREKEDSPMIDEILHSLPRPYLIPEGGTNQLALRGTQEITEEIYKQLPSTNIIGLSAGTGGTASGILRSKNENSQLEVYSSLKGDFLAADIMALSGRSDFDLISDYHFGGYGKTKPTLIKFINQFYIDHNIVLDPVYNGKGVYGVLDRIRAGVYPSGSTLVWILTGGQQGNTAWNYMKGGGLVTLES